MPSFDEEFLAHHGILGQKWGVRRFQNEDGSLTDAGKKRYGYFSGLESSFKRNPIKELIESRKYRKLQKKQNKQAEKEAKEMAKIKLTEEDENEIHNDLTSLAKAKDTQTAVDILDRTNWDPVRTRKEDKYIEVKTKNILDDFIKARDEYRSDPNKDYRYFEKLQDTYNRRFCKALEIPYTDAAKYWICSVYINGDD